MSDGGSYGAPPPPSSVLEFPLWSHLFPRNRRRQRQPPLFTSLQSVVLSGGFCLSSKGSFASSLATWPNMILCLICQLLSQWLLQRTRATLWCCFVVWKLNCSMRCVLDTTHHCWLETKPASLPGFPLSPDAFHSNFNLARHFQPLTKPAHSGFLICSKILTGHRNSIVSRRLGENDPAGF